MRTKDVIYRSISDDFNEGVIACGYMPKPTAESSQFHFVTGYYSGFFVLSGTGTYIEEDGTHISIHPGCFVQRFPGRVHSTRINPDGQWLEFFVCIGKTVYESMKNLHMLPESPVVESLCDTNDLASFDDFLENVKNAPLDQLYLLLPKAQETLLKMSRHSAMSLSSTLSENTNFVSNPSNSTIRKACALLSSDFSKEIDSKALAEQLHMSYENFRKIFKRQTGTSPLQYRIQQKIRHAQLLLSSGMSIKEAARQTGYGDVYAFTKQFTKTTGTSPGEYVREMREMLAQNH